MNEYIFKFFPRRMPNEVADRFYTYDWRQVETTHPKHVIGTAINRDGELIAAFELRLWKLEQDGTYDFKICKLEVVPELQHEGYGVGILNSLYMKYNPNSVDAEYIDPDEDGGASKEWLLSLGYNEIPDSPCNILYKDFK